MSAAEMWAAAQRQADAGRSALAHAQHVLISEDTVQRVQRASGGHIRSDETVSAAIREIHAILGELAAGHAESATLYAAAAQDPANA